MAKPGRPANKVPTVGWRLYIPVDLAAEIELLCLDPVTQQQRYGARAALVEQALREYLDKYKLHDTAESDNATTS